MTDNELSVPMPALPAQPDDVPWPTRTWPTAELDDAVDTEALRSVYRNLIDEAEVERTGETHALLVVHRGRLVAEGYGPGLGPDDTLISWSMAKSITHALVGIRVRDGGLDIHAPAPVPAWQKPGDPRAAITTEHLLRMCDGLDFTEAYVPDQKSHVIDMLFQTGKDDVVAYAESRPLAHAPGRFWNYSSGTSNIVSAVVARSLGGADREAMWAFMRKELFERIGMRSATARFDAAGNFIASSYVFATARDFARFGLLYLRDGCWDGERILPPGWVDHGRSLCLPSFDQYGAHWWLARDGSGIFHASGFNGQYIAIVPSRDLVVVRLGKTDEAKRPAVLLQLRDAVESFPLL